MIKKSAIIFSLFVCSTIGPLAAAADIMEARTSLTSGFYDQAFEQARQIGNTEALLLGAEVLNTKILLGYSENPKKDAQQAMQIAEDILGQDPTNNQAQLLYAISYAFYGRSVSPLKAWRKKLPQKTEAAILDAVKTNPKDANSYALYGGWHMSVSAKAGVKTAKRMYGASIEDGIAHFEKAKSISPNDMMISANYALMLFALDDAVYQNKIENLFAEILKSTPKNTAEKTVQNLVLQTSKSQDSPKKTRKKIETFLGW